MRDASSGSGHVLPSRSSSDSNGLSPHVTAGDLTQELAQLLAASIARQQGGKGLNAQTNATLTSLADLVTGTPSQRTLVPVNKDGLSALSYSSQRPKPVARMMEPEVHEQHLDDEPMPIPSTWRQPTYGDEDRWYRQPMGAALLGLAAGLAIVVPTVLWLSGWFDPSRARAPAIAHVSAAVAETRIAEVRTVRVQPLAVEKPAEAAVQYVTGSIESRAAPETNQPATDQPSASALAAKFADTPAAEVRDRKDELLAQASQRIESGDVAKARELLLTAEDSNQGAVLFVLAETYDPNMLAAWGSRGVAADVVKARALYRKALGLGFASAQGRLDGLK